MAKEKEQRLPPQSIESELAVLGCILIDPQSLSKIHYIKEYSFYKKTHSIIFTAMQSLSESGESIDIITLTEKLKHVGQRVRFSRRWPGQPGRCWSWRGLQQFSAHGTRAETLFGLGFRI